MIYLKDGNIPLNLAYDDDIVQEANSTYQLSFKFPLTDGKWNLLRREVFLLADDLHGEQEFFIFEVKKVNGYVQVYAKQVATLLNHYSINTISVNRVPGQTAMTALAGSIKRNCPFTFFSDIMDRHTFNESNVSVMDALAKDKHSIVGQWGGDLVRDKYQVKLLKNGGIENESLFMYKKNLSSYEEAENINNLKTRLHLKKTIQGQSEGEADRVLAVTVDSPLIGQYRQIYEADIEVNDQDVTDVASLTAYGKRYFSSTLCDLVENTINLDVKGKADVSVKMFDTVSVFHERFDVDLRLKITSYHFGPMSKRLKSIGFGKVSQSVKSTVASMVADSVDKATDMISTSFEQKLQKEIDNANRHFDAEFDKRVESINDGIERSKAEAELYADNIKRSIDTEIAQVNQSMQAQSEEHDRQVAAILSKTQSIESLTNQAKTDAASALDRANQVKSEAIADARAQVATVSQALNTAKSELQTAIASADQKARDSQASATALTNRVTTVETLADGTRSTVAELSRTMQEATQDIASVSSRTRAVEDTLSQTRTRYEALTQTVNAQTGQIESINRKTADLQSGIDGVTERFENLRVGGRNLIPGTAAFSGTHWENYGTLRLENSLYKGAGVLTWVSGTKASPIANISVQSGETYTFSAYVKKASPGTVYFYLYDTGETRFATANVPRETLIRNVGDSFQRFSITFTITRSGILRPRFAIVASDTGGFSVAGYQLEAGTVATDWSPAPEDQQSYTDTKLAEYRTSVDGRFTTLQTSLNGKANQADFQRVQETSQLYERVIGSTETGIKDKVARMVMADSGFREEVLDKVKGTYTTVTHLADSWAVQNLTSAGDVLGQINLNSDGSVRLNDGLISIGKQTIIEDGVIKNAMIGDLDAGKIITGTLDADRIEANSIGGSKIVFDEAFFTGLTANQAYLKTLFAKNAFITSVQAVTLSASQITSGSLKASNNNMAIHLDEAEIEFKNNAKIRFLSSDNSISRTTPGLPKQFLKFETGQFVQYGKTKLASRLVLGSNSDNVENAETDRFSGQRWWQARDGASMGELVANQVLIYSNGTHRGPLVFNTGGSVKSIHPTAGSSWDIGLNEAKFRYMYVYDIYLQNGTRIGRALKDLANRVGHNGWADNLS